MATNNKNGIFGTGMGHPVEPGVSSSSSSDPAFNEQPTSQSNASTVGQTNFESIDRQSAAGSNTLKRNPKMELTKNDLLKLLAFMEGELQAQTVVIAALKSERLKQVVSMGRYKPMALNDPQTALLRDSVAMGGSANVSFTNERELCFYAEQQKQALDNLVLQQRRMHIRMANILKECEEKHRKVIQELEEEKRKHEHDTAQGDDITYGLEMERTRLKQELEIEKQAKKKTEKDQKKLQESVEDERNRQKQIVLLLLAERNKIISKYIEERKRSEDLAQILSEEKARIDAMAEGLEEESKKSLRMEAELEKHMLQFENERKALRACIAADEQRIKELEAEVIMFKAVVGNVKSVNDVSADKHPGRESSASGSTLEALGMPSSVAKVMQPTSTVTSVPVSGPTTGIAQTIQSTQGVRSPVPVKSFYTPRMPATATGVAPHPPPKKSLVVSRGAPPPIPPNKPVVPPKRDAVERRPSTASGITGGASTVTANRIGMTATVRTATTSISPSVTSIVPSVSKSMAGNTTAGSAGAIANNMQSQVNTAVDGDKISSSIIPNLSHTNTEIMGQELADFQKILGSMAASPAQGTSNINSSANSSDCS